MKTKTPAEKTIENYLKKRVREIGGKCIKMIPTYENGIPDRQVLYKGRAIFVELKKQGKEARPLQVVYMQELNKQGFETRVIDTKEQIDQLIKALENA
jgi:hypothetical protein